MIKTDETNSKIFSYVEQREADDPGFLGSIRAMYAHNAKWSNTLIAFFVHLCALFLKPKRRTIKYLFWGNKFSELIKSLPASDVCVIGGPKQVLFCIKHRINFLPCMPFWRLLESGLQKNSNDLQRTLAQKIDYFSTSLITAKRDDAVFIVDNDSLPMQRVAIIAAKKANISKNICIQHGIFQSKSPSHIFDGWFAEEFFVINDAQRNMLIGKGMESSRLKVMGFHSNPYKPMRSLAEPGKRTVCFLGQPWVKYGEARAHRYIEIVELIFGGLTAAGVDIYYKPHPWEKACHTFDRHIKTIDIPLHKAIEEHDVFISLTSTALFEAHDSGRVAIQIVDVQFDADTFSDTKGIHSINSTESDMIDRINNLVYKDTISTYAVEESVDVRFIKALNQ